MNVCVGVCVDEIPTIFPVPSRIVNPFLVGRGKILYE